MNADQRREIEERIEVLVDATNSCDDVNLMLIVDGLVESLCACGYPCRIAHEDDGSRYLEKEYED